ncbi:MAG TPA: WD40 repeat domain-containing protein, partial [Opitutaceae bacterium]|nr:WD40 repeat domain-containing protein [Opitutaceae bacterium]
MKRTWVFLSTLAVTLSPLALRAQAPAAPVADAAPASRNVTAPAPPGAPAAPNAQGRAGRGFGGFGPQNPPGPPVPIIEPITVFLGPASMELLLPAGATATVDGKDAGAQRVFEFNKFAPNGVQRVEVAVKFADGTEAKRTVDLPHGSRVRVPINLPPVDAPSTVLIDSAVAVLWASFSPNGRLVATAAENGAVVIWDLALGRPVRNFSGHRDGVSSVVFSPDGEQLLTASVDTLATLWNVSTGRAVRRFSGHTGPVTSAVFSADGKKILTGSGDKTAILWDANTGGKLRTFTGHTDEVVTVAFSPDGKLVATGSTDKMANLWNAETGEKVNSLRTFDTVSGVAFSPDGNTLAASNFSNNVNLWAVATGKPIASTRRVNLDLNSMAFAPDGRFIFTAGKDATAKLWDANSRDQLREFTGHAADVQSVAASPDGKLLLTSSRDGTARIFEVATGVELVSLATSQAGRNWAVVGTDGFFDGSEAGRRMIGYRFSSKLPGAAVDQFFGHYYRPGLLAEIFNGERPMAPAQMGRKLPPVLKIVSPKVRSTADAQITLEVEATNKGGGVSAPQIFNNGARLAVEPAAKREADIVRYSFPVTLGAGSNQFRITAASDDGSWEAIPVELELNCTRRAERKGRLFVVAVGIADPPPMADAQALAGLLQRRSAGLYDRVDVVSVLGQEATRTRIRDTLLDIANLSQPHDTVMLLVCGRGRMLGERLYLAPHDLRLGTAAPEEDFRKQGLDADDLAGLLGTARALNRILVLDASDVTQARNGGKPPTGFALRASVERWSRAQGVHAIAACSPTPGLLVGLLLDAAGSGGMSMAPGAA